MSVENLERKELQVTPEGVLHIHYHQLRLSALKARRTRLESEILNLQNTQRYHESEIKKNARKLQELEYELAFFNSPEVSEWMKQRERELREEREKQRQEKIEATRKAQQFLRQYIGEENFSLLQRKKYLDFEAHNRIYRLTSKGKLSRKISSGNWRTVCVVRPRNLPLPDFIVSVLTSVKHGKIG